MLEFRPLLTPSEMLQEGICGGSYFGVQKLQGDQDYLSLFKTLGDIDPTLYLGSKYRPKLNKFKVRSGMPFEYWVDMKWMHADDPYGWFEWYIKYFNGRRHPDDDRQIRRWQDFAGTSGRWRNNIYRCEMHGTGSGRSGNKRAKKQNDEKSGRAIKTTLQRPHHQKIFRGIVLRRNRRRHETPPRNSKSSVI